MKRSIVWLIILLISGWSLFAQGKRAVTFPKYASLCIYNFFRNVDWPEDVKNQNFKVAIVGDKQVYDEVSSFLGSRAYGRYAFEVNFFKSADDCQTFHHILFLDKAQSHKLNGNNSFGSKTLIITENEGAISKGSMINFVSRNGIIKFELSPNNIKSQGLLVNSSLTNMAILVNN
jgi:hypothetical protein